MFRMPLKILIFTILYATLLAQSIEAQTVDQFILCNAIELAGSEQPATLRSAVDITKLTENQAVASVQVLTAGLDSYLEEKLVDLSFNLIDKKVKETSEEIIKLARKKEANFEEFMTIVDKSKSIYNNAIKAAKDIDAIQHILTMIDIVNKYEAAIKEGQEIAKNIQNVQIQRKLVIQQLLLQIYYDQDKQQTCGLNEASINSIDWSQGYGIANNEIVATKINLKAKEKNTDQEYTVYTDTLIKICSKASRCIEFIRYPDLLSAEATSSDNFNQDSKIKIKATLFPTLPSGTDVKYFLFGPDKKPLSHGSLKWQLTSISSNELTHYFSDEIILPKPGEYIYTVKTYDSKTGTKYGKDITNKFYIHEHKRALPNIISFNIPINNIYNGSEINITLKTSKNIKDAHVSHYLNNTFIQNIELVTNNADKYEFKRSYKLDKKGTHKFIAHANVEDDYIVRDSNNKIIKTISSDPISFVAEELSGNSNILKFNTSINKSELMTNESFKFKIKTGLNVSKIFLNVRHNNKLEKLIQLNTDNYQDWESETIAFESTGAREVVPNIYNKLGNLVAGSSSHTIIVTDSQANSINLTKPVASAYKVASKQTISVSTTADRELPESRYVCLEASSNTTRYRMQPDGSKKWKYSLTLNKAGSHKIAVYMGDDQCNLISKESNPSNVISIEAVPSATVVKVVTDNPQVVDGKSMRFTATVSGNVDEANGDQVLLWLDSYKQAMQRVSGTQTWTTTVTNIVGVNGKRDYTARVQNGDLYSTDAPHGTLTVKLSDALLVVDAYDISPQPKRIDKAKLNDHVNFIVDSVGAVNGSIKIKINNWISQSLVNIGANKWKTAESIPLQQAEVKTYYAFVEVKGQEASKSTAKVITVTKDSGLVCPAVANTGDLYDAELHVDRRNESIKNAVLHIDACNGKSDDKTITFSESGSGWKWPGIRIADNYCGTFKVSVTSSKNSYTCVTKVNLGSSSPPIVPPATSNDSALLSSNGVQYRLSERLISGDVWQISLTIESKPADFSLVKGKFAGSGLLTVSGASAGTVFFTQAGNSWTYQVKGTPGTYSYTPVFKIGTKTLDAPARTFTITNASSINQTPAPRIPEGSVQCVIQPSNTGQMKFDCSLSNSALSSDLAKLSLQCSDAFSFNIPKISSNSYITSIDFPEGKRTCNISAHGTNHSISPFTTSITVTALDIESRTASKSIELAKQLVNQLYKEFAGSYNDKNDSKLRGMISDDWESVGDGTTLADLEMNLRSSFRIFDQVSYTIQNLQISPIAYGRFRVTYDALIKGQIYKSRINHEEKSSVSEEVEVDPNGKARITKTLSGRFWYVQ